jgi:hypothetical protein
VLGVDQGRFDHAMTSMGTTADSASALRCGEQALPHRFALS